MNFSSFERRNNSILNFVNSIKRQTHEQQYAYVTMLTHICVCVRVVLYIVCVHMYSCNNTSVYASLCINMY